MNGNHTTHTPLPSTSNPQEMPDVQVFLSRSAYQLGEAVVGTVLIRPPQRRNGNTSTQTQQQKQQIHNNSYTQESLRKALQSVVVYMVGFCRIDSRWHNVADYTKIYGTVHPCLQMLYSDFDADLIAPPAAEETVCFWATYGLELLDLQERSNGAIWQQQQQQQQQQPLEENGNMDASSSSTNKKASPPFLAFTFRADIPLDLPQSMNATTCRYHYSANVLIKTPTKQRVIKTPFAVWANPYQPLGIPRSQQRKLQQSSSSFFQNGNKKHTMVIPGARVKFGTSQGLAHSNGYPCHLSATEVHRPKGQMTVAMTSRTRDDDGSIQTLRVSNAHGQPVCVLTIVGASQLTPGSRIHLQWDFPERISANKAWIPCHQVAACLSGEELALYEDGSTTRTQSHVFDTCHEWVDPGVTHRVSKTLLLSVDAPCNLYTDVMELYIRCQVDITVKENGGEYNNLSIELPCHVVQRMGESNNTIFYDEDQQVASSSLSELLGNSITPRESQFPTADILETDLKSLALQMEDHLKLYSD